MFTAALDLTEFRSSYLRAVRSGSWREARQVVDEAMGQGVDPADLFVRIFQPALVSIGSLWAQGDLTVAREHLATSITRGLMGQLAPRFRPDRSGGDRTALVACVADEFHDLGLSMLTSLFERDGWEVLNLGAATPTDDLVDVAVVENVDLLGLSVTLDSHVPAAREVVRLLREQASHISVGVGGAVIAAHPQLADVIGADFYAEDAIQALARANELVRTRRGGS